MAGYSGKSKSNNAIEAEKEGKKPISQITKNDIANYGITENISFFRWFIKNNYPADEWHHTSYKFNETWFYPVEKCCNFYKALKKTTKGIEKIEEEKNKYKEELKIKKGNTKNNPYYGKSPYYAKIEYSISTYTGKRKDIEAYAIIHKSWAYMYGLTRATGVNGQRIRTR